ACGDHAHDGTRVERRVCGERESAAVGERARALLHFGGGIGVPRAHGVERRGRWWNLDARGVHEYGHSIGHWREIVMRVSLGAATGWGRDDRYDTSAPKSSSPIGSSATAARVRMPPSAPVAMKSLRTIVYRASSRNSAPVESRADTRREPAGRDMSNASATPLTCERGSPPALTTVSR